MSFEQNLKRMYSEFTEEQQYWFQNNLPKVIIDWVNGSYNGKVASKNPKLIEEYANRQVSLSRLSTANTLDEFIYAMWCIRKCHGPIRAPKLYRLTAFSNPNESSTVRIECKNSMKPITSWSSDPNVQVMDREPTFRDYVLRLDNVDTKHLLGSTEILWQMSFIVLDNAKDFGIDSKVLKTAKKSKARFVSNTSPIVMWTRMQKEIRTFLKEKEYLIYLHPHESITAHVDRKLMASKDDYIYDSELADSVYQMRKELKQLGFEIDTPSSNIVKQQIDKTGAAPGGMTLDQQIVSVYKTYKDKKSGNYEQQKALLILSKLLPRKLELLKSAN